MYHPQEMGEVERGDARPRAARVHATIVLSLWGAGALAAIWMRTMDTRGMRVGAGIFLLGIAVAILVVWLIALVWAIWHAVRYRTPVLPLVVVVGSALFVALFLGFAR